MTTEQPAILPQSEQPANYGPVKQAPIPIMPTKRMFPFWIVILVIIFCFFFALLLIKKNITLTQTTTPQSTPTPTYISIQQQPLSSIATMSAFLEFETQLDIVLRGIQNAPIDNPSLLPPKIDLPLGF